MYIAHGKESEKKVTRDKGQGRKFCSSEIKHKKFVGTGRDLSVRIARNAYGIVEDCYKIHPQPPPAGDTAAASANQPISKSTNQQINKSTNLLA